ALERARSGSYQLLVLDLQLPDLDGLSICAEVRRDPRTVHLPIVMLTARGDEIDRVVGLEGGADDYIVKPFSPKELVARVRSLFRRMERRPPSDGPLVFRVLEEVWGYSYAEGTRTVDVHIRRLREKIPELAPSILTVKSLGYRIAEEPS